MKAYHMKPCSDAERIGHKACENVVPTLVKENKAYHKNLSSNPARKGSIACAGVELTLDEAAGSDPDTDCQVADEEVEKAIKAVAEYEEVKAGLDSRLKELQQQRMFIEADGRATARALQERLAELYAEAREIKAGRKA